MVTCPPDESVPTTTLPPASEYSRRNAATLAYPSRRPLTRGPDHTSLCLAGTNPSPGSLLICAASLRNCCPRGVAALHSATPRGQQLRNEAAQIDRKSTRLNSSHGYISYAVFCLKKKKKTLLERLNES